MPRRRAVRKHAIPPNTQRGEDARDHSARAGADGVAARPRCSQEADELTDQVVAVVRKQLRPQLRRERLEPRGAARRAGGLLRRRRARRPRSTARVELALDVLRDERRQVRTRLLADPEARHIPKGRRVSNFVRFQAAVGLRAAHVGRVHTKLFRLRQVRFTFADAFSRSAKLEIRWSEARAGLGRLLGSCAVTTNFRRASASESKRLTSRAFGWPSVFDAGTAPLDESLGSVKSSRDVWAPAMCGGYVHKG